MVTTPGRDDSAASYDPMRQFAELAGDVRDPYPMLAGIRGTRRSCMSTSAPGPAAGTDTTKRLRGSRPCSP